MVVADAEHIFQITGGGDVIEPHEGIVGIGSGGPFATAAASCFATRRSMLGTRASCCVDPRQK